MCVFIVSNGYPTAHATAPAHAPHDISSIEESYCASPSRSICSSTHFLLKYSYEANHTPCGTPSLNTVGPNPLNATAMFLQLFRVNLSATSLADPPRTCWFTFNSSNGATTNDWTIPPHTPPMNTGVKRLPVIKRLSPLVWSSPLCSIILLHRSPTPYPTNKSIFCNGITIVAAGRPRKKAL